MEQFFATVNSILVAIDDFIWGVPLMVLILAGGILLTVRLRGLQFAKLPRALRYMMKNEKGEDAHGGEQRPHSRAGNTAQAAQNGEAAEDRDKRGAQMSCKAHGNSQDHIAGQRPHQADQARHDSQITALFHHAFSSLP